MTGERPGTLELALPGAPKLGRVTIVLPPATETPGTAGLPLVPLPVKYRLYFGEPIQMTGDPDDDDDVLDDKARIVKHRIQSMIHTGLRERTHVFW